MGEPLDLEQPHLLPDLREQVVVDVFVGQVRRAARVSRCSYASSAASVPISLVPSERGVLAPAACAAYAMRASRSSSARSERMALRRVSVFSRIRRQSR